MQSFDLEISGNVEELCSVNTSLEIFRTDLIFNAASTQYGTLIHELIDKYLHLNGMDQAERYSLRDVIGDRWDEAGKVANAENYAFFASCKSDLVILVSAIAFEM